MRGGGGAKALVGPRWPGGAAGGEARTHTHAYRYTRTHTRCIHAHTHAHTVHTRTRVGGLDAHALAEFVGAQVGRLALAPEPKDKVVAMMRAVSEPVHKT